MYMYIYMYVIYRCYKFLLLIDVPEKKPPLETKEEKKMEEKQISVLDDLFRKTKATPSIYWLPLSEEEVYILYMGYNYFFTCTCSLSRIK